MACCTTTLVLYVLEHKKTRLGFSATLIYFVLSILEGVIYFLKILEKRAKRRALKRAPVKRRHSADIKMPPITVTAEVRHLRAKSDFVVNGTPYIRKGETVELLKTIGSYYSVRNSSGTEYIVPKGNFF